MATLFEYIQWRGDLSLDQVPLSEVDGLILVAFSYITPPDILKDAQDVTVFQLNEGIKKLPAQEQKALIRNENDLILLEEMAKSPRFRNIRITYFTEILDTVNEMQFAAYCLELSSRNYAVVFRGTDHSITGWKEDFNLSFLDRIPGQTHAADFLNFVAENISGDISVMGHSKGGNLAVFAATTCPASIAKRIRAVYNYDGPGFSEDFIKQEGYLNMVLRLHTYLPESSIVGLLFEHEEPFEVVESKNVGVTQHEPYSWSVMGGSILRTQNRSASSYVMDHALHSWLASMTKEQRAGFVEALFGLLSETDASTLEDIVKPKTVLLASKHFKGAGEEERNMLFTAMSLFAKSVSDSIKQSKSPRSEKLQSS